ncbi:MAG: hypothetical protein V3V05_00920 [Pontiella sp.]
MLNYLILIAVLCCAGCQSTPSSAKGEPSSSVFPRSEKLSLRVEKYATSYNVEVQRAVLTPSSVGGTREWNVVSAPRVSGYPENWLNNESIIIPVKRASKASYLLNGSMVDVSLDPGVHLIAQVLPVMQNKVRVIGIFSESRETPLGMEVISIPFDIICPFGELNVIYHEEIDVNSSLM